MEAGTDTCRLPHKDHERSMFVSLGTVKEQGPPPSTTAAGELAGDDM